MTEDHIDNICGDLKNALCNLADNGPNDVDEASVQYHINQIDEIFEELKGGSSL